MSDLFSAATRPSGPWWLRTAQPAAVSTLLQRDGYVLLTPEAVTSLAHCSSTELAQLQRCWDDLPTDEHLKDGGTYRRRRHGSFVQDLREAAAAQPFDGLRAVPHRPHWQPTTYNALHGGMLRHFAPLTAALSQSPAFLHLVAGLGRCFADAVQAQPSTKLTTQPGEPSFDGRWFIEVHPFRIDANSGMGRPTPEGAHRDGVSFVAVVLVDRVAVRGGETRVFEAEGPHGVRFTLQEPWSALLLDDVRVVHESTPIQPDDAAPGQAPSRHRDTLVITYRAQAFQDPP